MKIFILIRWLSVFWILFLVIGILYCIDGVSESGGFVGGKGWSNGVLCEGFIGVVEGIGGVLEVFVVMGVEVRGGGIKKDGFMRVVWILVVVLGVLRVEDGVKEVRGKVVDGEIIDGIGNGEWEVILGVVCDCNEWVVGGWDVVVGIVLGVVLCIVLCCIFIMIDWVVLIKYNEIVNVWWFYWYKMSNFN